MSNIYGEGNFDPDFGGFPADEQIQSILYLDRLLERNEITDEEYGLFMEDAEHLSHEEFLDLMDELIEK